MVLIFKKHTGLQGDIANMCKMMLNVENNTNLYKLNGTKNSGKVSKEPYNYYTNQGITYDIDVSIGVVLIYVSNGNQLNIQTVKNDFKCEFAKLKIVDEKRVPICIGSSNSSTYTLLSKKPESFNVINSVDIYIRSYRKFICNDHDIDRCVAAGTKFTWLIKIVDIAYLYIPELCDSVMQHEYLSKSISTIIYDGINLLDMKHGAKQLDYPSVIQYKSFNKKKILVEPIHITHLYGLDYEIMSHYFPNITKSFVMCSSLHNNHHPIEKKNYTDFEIRRRNPMKKWYRQLSELYDYKTQEELELTSSEIGKEPYPLGVCFITGMPLYKNAYVLKVSHCDSKSGDDEKNTGITRDNSSYIMVGSFILHTYIKKNNMSCRIQHYMGLCGVKIIDCYLTNYDRCETDVIMNLPISQVKKDIMSTISINGIHNVNDHRIITCNVEKNIIYCGFKDYINDIDIIKYMGTDTVIFRYTNNRPIPGY